MSERKDAVYPRFLLAAGASGSGKTTITCGILQVLKNRGLRVSSFKCGPDYIDPMFHAKVLKTRSRNMDTFFTDEQTTRYLFVKNAKDADLSVIEGVMGYYDGVGGISDSASAYDIASITETPVVLVVNTRGMSLSALAYIRGFLTYREDSHIRGVILNQMPAILYPEMKQRIEEELGVRVFGYVPKITECAIDSRRLGLAMPDEVEELEEKMQKLADVLEQCLDIDGLLELAKSAGPMRGAETPEALEKIFDSEQAKTVQRERPVIAVARDEAFCFIYENNLQLLRDLGAELIEFSPLHDGGLPKEADGVLLYGGYPELYAEKLSLNTAMTADVRKKLQGGLPCMAECGGFMYLHRTVEDMQRRKWQMVGLIDAEAFRTEKPRRFGYVALQEIGKESGGTIRGHEFHYFDSTNNGESYLARKPLRKRSWKCIHKTGNLMVGFPHLYYYSCPQMALDFLVRCIEYKRRKEQ